MIPKTSAGLLMYRIKNEKLELLLAHPGGPFYTNKDDGVWSLPKGELEEDEELLAAAKREFFEETCITSSEPYTKLGTTTLKTGKTIHAWAFKGDWNGFLERMSMFSMEWPPRSGQTRSFPEVDKLAFFTPEQAKIKIHPQQAVFIDRLLEILKRG